MRALHYFSLLLATALHFVQCANVRVLRLSGSFYEMGVDYGATLVVELQATLMLLVQFFEERGVPRPILDCQADQFHQRYAAHSLLKQHYFDYPGFLNGIARGSGLSIADIRLLNGMETLSRSAAHTDFTGKQCEGGAITSGCTFVCIPPERSITCSNLIGRYYDFLEPFDRISANLIVVGLHPRSSTYKPLLPVILIGLPGQIYCSSCINSEGLFTSINNAAPSVGNTVPPNQRRTLLLNLLEMMHLSETAEQLEQFMSAVDSDFALVVNSANADSCHSYEYSPQHGMKRFLPRQGQTFVSTNFFQNESWILNDLSLNATDDSSWMGFTRRNNLIRQLDLQLFYDDFVEDSTEFHGIVHQDVQESHISREYLMRVMDLPLSDSGAITDYTIYQLIYDPHEMLLLIRPVKYKSEWTYVPINQILTAVVE